MTKRCVTGGNTLTWSGKAIAAVEAERHLREGLYELLETGVLGKLLENTPGLYPLTVEVQDEDAPEVLSRHLAEEFSWQLNQATELPWRIELIRNSMHGTRSRPAQLDSIPCTSLTHLNAAVLSTNEGREHGARCGNAPEFTSPLTVSRDDLANTTWLTTNFWMGSTGSTVKVQLDGGGTVEAVRTQQMHGEGQLPGAEYYNPVAVQEQLVHGGSLADRMMHLWRIQLPADLAAGEHTATVTATDVYARTCTETLTFTVAY